MCRKEQKRDEKEKRRKKTEIMKERLRKKEEDVLQEREEVLMKVRRKEGRKEVGRTLPKLLPLQFFFFLQCAVIRL